MIKVKKSDTSSTFVPQYDSVLTDSEKKEITDVPLSTKVLTKVKNLQAKNNFVQSN